MLKLLRLFFPHFNQLLLIQSGSFVSVCIIFNNFSCLCWLSTYLSVSYSVFCFWNLNQVLQIYKNKSGLQKIYTESYKKIQYFHYDWSLCVCFPHCILSLIPMGNYCPGCLSFVCFHLYFFAYKYVLSFFLSKASNDI